MESEHDSPELSDVAIDRIHFHDLESAQRTSPIVHIHSSDSDSNLHPLDQHIRKLQSKNPNRIVSTKAPTKSPVKSPVLRTRKPTRAPFKPTRAPVKRTRVPVKATKEPVAPSRVGELEPTKLPLSKPFQLFIPTNIPSPRVSKKPQTRFVPTPPPRDTGRSCPTPQSPSWQALADASGGELKKCSKDSDCADYHPEDGVACCSHPYCICATVYDYYYYDFQCLSF
jgi:hypothetical protein